MRSTGEDGTNVQLLSIFPKKTTSERRADERARAAPSSSSRTTRPSRDSLRDGSSTTRGYSVETASNGREALDLLQDVARHPDVMILDLVMPDLDGVAVYEAMQADATLSRILCRHLDVDARARQSPKARSSSSKPADLDHLIKDRR